MLSSADFAVLKELEEQIDGYQEVIREYKSIVKQLLAIDEKNQKTIDVLQRKVAQLQKK